MAKSLPVQPATPPPPPPPIGPKLGDKVGFIQLPPKPGVKLPEKVGGLKPVARPPEPRRTDFTKRGDIRSVRGTPPPAGPAIVAPKFPGQKGVGKTVAGALGPAPANIALAFG